MPHGFVQAYAAIGQPHLMRYYDEFFSALGQPIAQVLLSADALDSRSGYENAQASRGWAILGMGILRGAQSTRPRCCAAAPTDAIHFALPL